MKIEQQLKDLPIRYQRKGKHWIDTYSGEVVLDSLIYTKTRSYQLNKQQQIENKRWDLKID